MTNRLSLSVFLFILLPWQLQAAPPTDTIPRSLSLPPTYPDSWLFLQDLNYLNVINGKFIILDVAAEYQQHKGAFQGAQLANFAESKKRNELYVTETVYSRGTHGKRTDLLTIYDKVNLEPVAEVSLPGEKRALMLPQKAAMRLTGDGQFLLVFNFTPASSVTVVDMDKRQIVSEVPVPGCSLNYASGQRGFFSLCPNGTLVSFTLDEEGRASGEAMSQPFNDLDDDVLLLHPATINGITYLISFHGNLRPIDTSKNTPQVMPAWPLLTANERAAGWRPAELQPLTRDAAGRLYALMQQQTADPEKDVAEVWVYDVTRKKRLKRITLKSLSGAIEVTRGETPWLAAIGQDGVDVYNAVSGDFVRNIGGWASATPMLMHAAQ